MKKVSTGFITEKLASEGYVKVPLLSEKEVRELVKFYNIYRTQMGTDTLKVSSFLTSADLRRRSHFVLSRMIEPHLTALLPTYRLALSVFFGKEPGGVPIVPHLDQSSSRPASNPGLTCWVALSDASIDSGTLGFIKGSHKYFNYIRAYPVGLAPNPIGALQENLFKYLEFVPLKAGEALIYDSRTIHGSLANSTNFPRIAFTNILAPKHEGCRLYYQKPGERKFVYEYKADLNFLLQYDNHTLAGLYRNGKAIEGEPYSQLPFRLPEISWKQMEEKILQGNHNPSDRASFESC